MPGEGNIHLMIVTIKFLIGFGEKFALDVYSPDMVLEGGAIDTNGEGILMTTESVLLNPNRNPSMTREEIESNLKNYLEWRRSFG